MKEQLERSIEILQNEANFLAVFLKEKYYEHELNRKFEALINEIRVIKDLLSPYAELPSMFKWFDARGELPPQNVDVLVFDENYGVVVGYLSNGQWYMQSDEIEVTISLVTHWMPLPEPPK